MAAASLGDLEPMLASLNTLKPPGASRNKITAITQLSMTNVQAEQHITQCMYRALKKAPSTHKLGALYVIDSVVRQWIESAKKAGQDLHIEGRGEPGTYPAAVKRITELMPALIDDIVKVIPDDQKPKLENMIAIWERASTFPVKLLEDFRKKLSEPQSVSNVNGNGAPYAQEQGKQLKGGEKFRAPIPTRPLHSPVGYPPQRLYDQGFLSRKTEPLSAYNAGNAQQAPAPVEHAPQPTPSYQTPAAPPTDVNSILAALANSAPKPMPPQPVAQQPVVQQPPPPAQFPPHLAAMFANGFPSNSPMPPQQPPAFQQPPPSQPPPFNLAGFQPPPGFPGFPPQQPPSIPQTYAQAPPPPQVTPQLADPLGPLRSILPQNIVNDQAKLMQALNLLQDLQKGGLPMEQWGPILQAFNEQASAQPPAPQQQEQQASGGYDGYNGGRDRSRSPDRERRGGGGRGSPSYNAYEGPEQQDQRNGRGGRDKGRYRQRSPQGRNNNGGSMPPNGTSHGPKNVYFDNTLPTDHIRVFSRTLFVGGANGTQQEIAELFSRFGEVASCIPNREKRHAFVKMTTREHTLNAKAGVEALQNANDRETMSVARQTKWGVGFGPRECFDYQKGESVIPISRLTEADLKWMLTAEYGGTGGRQLEAGMAIEEPDIEIGAGVSSKAMSKRVVPDGGQQQQQGGGGGGGGGGKQHHKHDGGHHHGGKGRRGGRFHHHNRDDVGGGYAGMPPGGYQQVVRPEPVAVATPPAVPGFGFSLPGAR
jgi:protein NRD1